MNNTVIVNGLTPSHKKCGGGAMATMPDVCKTPSPGGPVPVPYPNIARASTLKSGSKSVKIHGQMVAIKGSCYASSLGDEAGTAGGIKSGGNRKEAKFISSSFTVKIEGKNVCRLSDRMTNNAGNTVSL